MNVGVPLVEADLSAEGGVAAERGVPRRVAGSEAAWCEAGFGGD